MSEKWVNRIVAGAIVAALLLTLFSIFELCTSQCKEGHKYHLLGLPFEIVGLVFFTTVALIFAFSGKYPILKPFIGLLFASALGSELMFIWIQKYMIGTWCPVCLGIAASIGIGCLALTVGSITKSRGNMMNMIWKSFGSCAAFTIGFLVAFVGVTKHDELQAAQNEIKNEITFGHKGGNIEVYLFTDWACPACRKLEPNLENISDEVMKEAKLTFVDHAVHPETLNYIPFHLSFMVNNKDQYFKIRKALTELSKNTNAPTEEEIEEVVKPLGVHYDQLDYADVALGIKYFKELGRKFKVKGTPTLIIVNTEAKKGKKLSGTKEITQSNVMKAIQTLQEL